MGIDLLGAARVIQPAQPEPLFYVKHGAVYQRPVRTERDVSMGFRVCDVCAGVDPVEVCAILNRGEPATE